MGTMQNSSPSKTYSTLSPFLKGQFNPWSPSNTSVFIQLGIAENTLCGPLLNNPFPIQTCSFEYGYKIPWGIPEFRQALASYFSTFWLNSSKCILQPENFHVGAGVTSVLTLLMKQFSRVALITPFWDGFK